MPSIPQFEQLEPLPDINEEIADTEMFYPKWQCFCCHDTGIVQLYLIRLVMPNYEVNRHKLVMCQNSGCNAFNQRWSIGLENFDSRFNPKICVRLDRFSREDWQETVKRCIDWKQLARLKAMSGTSDRTENDHREIQQRQQEVLAYDWAKACRAYEGRGEDG